MIMKILEALITLLFSIIAIAVLALIFALPVMLLWNWLLPSIFGLCTIGYWKAFGILVLTGFLFRSSVNVNNNK